MLFVWPGFSSPKLSHNHLCSCSKASVSMICFFGVLGPQKIIFTVRRGIPVQSYPRDHVSVHFEFSVVTNVL